MNAATTVIDASNLFQLETPAKRSSVNRPSHFLEVLLDLTRHKNNNVSLAVSTELNVLFNNDKFLMPDDEKMLVENAIRSFSFSTGVNEATDEESGGMHP